jgi:hypothetical protein
MWKSACSDENKMLEKLKLFYRIYLRQRKPSIVSVENELDNYRFKINVEQIINSFSGYSNLKIKKIRGKNNSNIYELNFNKKNERKKLVILSGVHGNESGAILAVKDIVKDMKTNPDFYKNVSIKIVFPLNSWGVKNFSRYDESGIDINRDFNKFRTKSARLQRSIIKNFKPDFVLSLHEGPQKGFFMHIGKHVPQIFIEGILSELAKNKVYLAERNYFGIRLKKRGSWPTKKGQHFFMWLLRMHTLGRYLDDKKIAFISFEGSWFLKEEKKRTIPHMLCVRAVAKTLNGEFKKNNIN